MDWRAPRQEGPRWNAPAAMGPEREFRARLTWRTALRLLVYPVFYGLLAALILRVVWDDMGPALAVFNAILALAAVLALPAVAAWRMLRDRIVVGPGGIRVPREPALPWEAVRDVRLREIHGGWMSPWTVRPAFGFEVIEVVWEDTKGLTWVASIPDNVIAYEELASLLAARPAA